MSGFAVLQIGDQFHHVYPSYQLHGYRPSAVWVFGALGDDFREKILRVSAHLPPYRITYITEHEAMLDNLPPGTLLEVEMPSKISRPLAPLVREAEVVSEVRGGTALRVRFTSAVDPKKKKPATAVTVHKSRVKLSKNENREKLELLALSLRRSREGGEA